MLNILKNMLFIMILAWSFPVAAQAPHQALPERANQPSAASQEAALHYRNGIAHGEAGRFTEAVRELNRAVALNPGNFEAHYYLGSAYAELGRFDQAIAAYERVLSLRPDDLDTHYALGRIYLHRRQYDAARRHARAVERLDPALARELLSTLQPISLPTR
jgi:tetratricopeptide (TPR) repeat protein